MGDLIKTNPPQPGSLESTIGKLTPTEKRICFILHKYSQLRSFPLNLKEILEWKDSLIEILGESLDVDALNFAVVKMLSEQIEYDKGKGIQNIFNALKQVIKTEDGKYKVRDFTW